MSSPVLELRRVSKRFGTRSAPIWALSDVSLSVEPGETLGIVGESGSGKSTVARIAVGLERPSSGEALVCGVPTGITSGTVLAQMVFQDPASSLDPLLRVARSVREPLDALGRESKGSRVRQVLESLGEVGLGAETGARFPAALSGGQKQRASIARAVVGLPRVIIYDEAVTALDVSVRAQVLNLLRRIQQQHAISAIFISHDLCTVAYMSDRIAVMYLGKIVEIGTTDELFALPGHPYTRSLLGAIPAMQQGKNPRVRVRLTGEPPSMMRPPPGCRFHTRCPLVKKRCEEEEPVLQPASNGTIVACHFAPVSESAFLYASQTSGIVA